MSESDWLMKNPIALFLKLLQNGTNPSRLPALTGKNEVPGPNFRFRN
jgi:hypothetical protein